MSERLSKALFRCLIPTLETIQQVVCSFNVHRVAECGVFFSPLLLKLHARDNVEGIGSKQTIDLPLKLGNFNSLKVVCKDLSTEEDETLIEIFVILRIGLDG